MTKNQIELIKARETERANRAQEALQSQGHQYSTAQSILRGLATSLIPKGDTILSIMDRRATRRDDANNRNRTYYPARERRRGDLA